MSELDTTAGLVDHLFRHEAGRIVSILARRLGVEQLDLVEEVVQDALTAALEKWPHDGIPDNPSAWLMTVARNRATDRLRRAANFQGKLERLQSEHDSAAMPSAEETRATGTRDADDQLVMILMCCHPTLAAESRVALTLKTVGGFSAHEVACAMLVSEQTAAKRIVRAKQRIREREIRLAMPEPEELSSRLESTCDVLYLMFNEGYAASEGDNLTRRDLCGEAIRLGRLLSAVSQTATPEVHALIALMCLQASRLPARTDADGALVRLEDQNRDLWDQALIVEGLSHLAMAASGERLSSYHLEAGIAACHVGAPTPDATDWARILALYDQLMELAPSPIVFLNRAVALGRVHGAAAAIEALRAIESNPALRDYYLLPAILGDLHAQAGDADQAGACYRRALEMRCSEPVRRFLRNRGQVLA